MYVLVTTTCKSLTDRDALIEAALSAKLAACVQVGEVVSHFVWEGKQQQAEEYKLEFKTRASLVPQLMQILKATHSYEVPEILVTEVKDGLPAYLQWMDESTR